MLHKYKLTPRSYADVKHNKIETIIFSYAYAYVTPGLDSLLLMLMFICLYLCLSLCHHVNQA